MPWKMNCLLCEAGTEWHLPRPRCGSEDLIAIQEHAMNEHGVTQEDLRRQKNVCLAPDHYEYRLPDGRPWLDAWKDQPPQATTSDPA